MRVLVAETNSSVKTFVTGRNYQVLIIGYDRVSGRLHARRQPYKLTEMLMQLRSCVDQIKSCQPPIGLLICDEGEEKISVCHRG